MFDANILFLFFSFVFLLAFFGNLFFKRTRFSDISILLIIGFLLSNVLNIVTDQQIEVLKMMSPFFGSLALIIIVFEGGLHLNFYKVIKEIGKVSLFTVTVFLITVVLSAIFLFLVFNVPFLYGLLIGSAIGGVSSAIVIPLILSSKSKDETKVSLTLESAITDSLCIIVFIVIFDLIVTQKSSLQFAVQNLLSAYAIATVIGVFAGIFWIKVLRDFNVIKEYNYLLTLSFLFLIYLFIEYAKGNGTFGVLIFGIVLGNSNDILKILRMKLLSIENVVSMQQVYKFQTEITLFIKAFFFIYLGLILDISDVTFKIIFMVIGLFIILLIARYLSIKLFAKDKIITKDKNYMLSLHARGLAAAVLGTYAVANGLINEYTIIILPIVFLIIFTSNLSTTIMFFFTDNQRIKELKAKEEEGTIKIK